MHKIAITGGGGYVGSALVPHLLSRGHRVNVLDTFWYGNHLESHQHLQVFTGDIRRPQDLDLAFNGCDAVIHLACVSNDPSFDLKPGLGKAINFSCFKDILAAVERAKVKRFIYASSSSVYGVKDKTDVVETDVCEPLTDYSKYKLLCEQILQKSDLKAEWVVVRPATVCGAAPRQRLDLVVNILAMDAMLKKQITVHGGDQLRPNINIKDMCAVYSTILDAGAYKVNRKVFNAGSENLSLLDIAKKIKAYLNDAEIEIRVQPTNDNRSYHVNSDKLRDSLKFVFKYTVLDAVDSLQGALKNGFLQDSASNPNYYNIRKMKELISVGKI